MVSNNAKFHADGFLNRLVDYSTPGRPGPAAVYQAVAPQVLLMSNVYLSMPGKGNPLAATTPEAVFADLISFSVLSGPEQMAEAVKVITDACNTYLTGSRRSFATLVGEGTLTTSDVMTMFQVRRDEEVQEQNDLLVFCTNAKTKLEAAAHKDKLAIPLSAVPATPAVISAPKTPKLNLFQRFLTVEDKKAAPEVAASSKVIPSWQTPPVLDEKSRADVAKIERIWKFLFEQNLEPAVVKTALMNPPFQMDDTALAALFSSVFDVLNRQIQQSQAILAEIEKDFNQYNGCLRAAMDLQSMLVEIGKFFGFSVGASSKAQPSKSK